ncbi:MAG: SusC/RagA family TonB-linked outer membrane protein, partial [Bacteroidota bacterium]
INTDVLLSYQRALGNDWNLNLGLGGNAMEQRLDYKSTEAGELSLPGIYNFENSRIPLVITQEKLAKRINSAYALAGLAYDKAIYLDLTFRNDWSSTLPAGQNSFGYYSAATSLVLSELLEMPEVINYAKLRLSGASVGNDTEPFQLTNTFAFNQNYGAFPLVTKTAGLLNANLRPERMQAVELGGEIWLWQDKLGLDVSVYQNVSTDQIIQLPTSAASGYVERVINGGRIRSRGLEASLSVGLYQGADFYWRATANFAANRSFVMELPEGVENYVTGFSSVYNSTQNAVFFVANPNLGRVGDMYGTGILQHEGQDVYDANGIPVRDPNLRLLGNYNPDFIMGLNNEFGYKNFKFSFLFDWRQGGIILSRLFSIGSTSGVLASTLPGREEGVIGEGVTNIGTTAEPQYVENTSRIAASDFYGQYYNRANEATATFDASYVKLRNISLSYDLPTGLTQKWGLGQASLALIANNVLLFTENPNVDPELSTMQGRRFAYGVEDMAYPSSRSLGVSLRIKL